jgi:hypothetical protein
MSWRRPKIQREAIERAREKEHKETSQRLRAVGIDPNDSPQMAIVKLAQRVVNLEQDVFGH